MLPNFLVAFSSLFAFILIAGQLALPNKGLKNYYMAGILLCLGYLQWHAYLFMGGLFTDFPHVFRTQVPFMFALGPLVYLFFVVMFEPRTRFFKRELLHFVPAIIMLGLLIRYFMKSGAEKIADSKLSTLDYVGNIYNLYIFLGNLWMLGYWIALVIKLWPLVTINNLKADANVRLFVVLSAMAFFGIISGTLAFLTQEIIFYAIVIDSVILILMMTYLIGQRHPQFLNILSDIVEKEKYSRSLIKDLDHEQIKDKLDHLMNDDKLYKNDNVSLTSLAHSLELTVHQLSEFLNAKLGKSFFQYINSVRIEDACRQLIETPEKTILAIAYSVGFNSKSSFNTAFTKLTGVTPSQYRKASVNQKAS